MSVAVTAMIMRFAESFFQLLKRERIKKSTERGKKPAAIFDYIEMFYNSKRRHGSSEQMSPTEYETSIINGSEVSRLSVAIHNFFTLSIVGSFLSFKTAKNLPK